MSEDCVPDTLTVLVVTDDEEYGAQLTTHLGDDRRFEVRTAGSVDGAIAAFTGDSIDCIVSDYALPDSDGVRFLQTIRTQDPNVPFILFTEHGTEEIVSDAVSADVTEYLIKDRFRDQYERLATLIDEAVTFHRQRADLVEPDTRTETILHAVPDAIFVVQDRRVVFCNESGRDLVGADETARLLGERFDQWLRVRDDDVLDRMLASIESERRAFDQREFELTGPDGPRPVEASVARITWETDPAVVLVVRDISDRKEIETELSLKSRAMDTAPVGITIAEPTTEEGDNPLLYVNDAFEVMTGYDRADVLGEDCRLLQGEATDEETVARLAEAIENDEPTTVELRNYRKDGTQFWNRLTVAPVGGGSEEEPYYVGFQEDISDQVEQKQDLRRFKRAVEAAGQAIFITDRDGTITYTNPAFEEVTGYTREEAVGRTPRILKSGFYDEEYYDRLWGTILAGETWKDEIVNRRKSGETYHTYQTIAPLTGDDGEIEEFVAIQTEITERKQQERHLNTLDRVLRHDLRNRLTVIYNHAESIQAEDGMDPDAHAGAIVDEIDRLLNIADRGREITELLLEPPRRRLVEIVPIVREEIDRLREAFPNAEIDLELACSESVRVTATVAIGDAIAELIENGIVHSDDPHPDVAVRLVEADDGSVRLHVEDGAERIPEMERSILTETGEVDDLHHGTGLDLWFVYWIVRRSNGTLSFAENDPRGNVVTIEFAS